MASASVSLSAAATALPASIPAPRAPVAATVSSPGGSLAPGIAAAVSSSRPFGSGVPVTLDCDKPFVYGFVAKGAVDTRPSYPDPFVKIGRLPLTIELPAGVYTLIVEGDAVTLSSTVFEVRNAPVRVKVKGGNSGIRSLSSWMLGFGIAAVLAAGVLELSGGGEQKTQQKHAIAIPLLIGGGVAAASGITMFVVSRTTFQGDGMAVGRAVSGGLGPGLTISGHF